MKLPMQSLMQSLLMFAADSASKALACTGGGVVLVVVGSGMMG